MHLAEAFLATLSVREDRRASTLELCTAMQKRFIDPQHGVLMEKPLGLWITGLSRGTSSNGISCWSHRRCCAARHCMRPWTAPLPSPSNWGGSADRCGAGHARLGRTRLSDATQRIWAQAEYLRALTLRPDSEAAVAPVAGAATAFLHSRGWYECRDEQGQVSRRDMPSTTPYHLATCYRGLAEYLADR
jgi:mannose-6-phosphate isomerase